MITAIDNNIIVLAGVQGSCLLTINRPGIYPVIWII
ncbi:hypothetical protein SAI_1113 [Streptococcus agalactiae H36B]|nr:hypothetical protein SAN_1157 [Streptococcus agalactiae COH1]EAO77885.1 hypothetical protein SAI_1113 [Streptococcus agalactiae H36B]